MRPLSLCPSLFVLLAPFLLARTAHADTLQVAAGGTYATPCAAVAAAKAGDTIEIAAGAYVDACKIGKSLTLRGTGGRPVITASSPISNGKGIFAIEGADTDVVIENLELTGAKVPDENGAGIRAQGRALTVRGCVFRENEDGILGGDGGTVTIEHSTFDRNGDGKGYAHNVYIGAAKKLVFRGNYSRAAKVGHLLKSRAEENVIIANRLTGEDGTESYESDFPNGGRTLFAFNLVQQGTATENPNLVAYGLEGLKNPVNELVVAHNTFVNGRGKGNETFVVIAGDFKGDASIINNVFQGGGTITTYAGAIRSGNLEGDGGLVDTAGFDFHLTATSKAKDAGIDVTALLGGQVLLAYVHPANDAPRTNVGAPDAGAYELGDTGAGGTSGVGGNAGAAGAGTAGTSAAAGNPGTAGTSAAAGNPGTAGTSAAAGNPGTAGNPASAGAAGAKPATGGAGGSSASGGAAGSIAAAPAPSSDDGGCGCRITKQDDRRAPFVGLLVGLALGLVARRRAR